jgi:hypothetical protein
LVNEGPGSGVEVDVSTGVAVLAGVSVCLAVGSMDGVGEAVGVAGAQALNSKSRFPRVSIERVV